MVDVKAPRVAMMDGKLVPYADALVHVDTPAFRYGAMAFEGLRAYWNAQREQLYVYRLPEHLERLAQSAKVMRFRSTPTAGQLAGGVLELLRANDLREDVQVRLMAWVDGSGGSHADGPIRYGAVAKALGRAYDVASGVQACVSSWLRSPDNAIPPRVKAAANYQNARLATMQARIDGYDVALLLDSHGHLTETPTSCVLLVRGGAVVAPPVYADILESVTRDTVLRLARDAGLGTEERPVDRTELYVAEEMFLCGSTAEIVPIVGVDQYPVQDGRPGPITRRLQDLYFHEVRAEGAEAAWVTPVYR